MKKQTRIVAIFLLLFTSISVVKTLANDPSVEDWVTPAWRFWGESIRCGWQASNGHIANELPDGTCCVLETHATFYFGIKFHEETNCRKISCPENPNR